MHTRVVKPHTALQRAAHAGESQSRWLAADGRSAPAQHLATDCGRERLQNTKLSFLIKHPVKEKSRNEQVLRWETGRGANSEIPDLPGSSQSSIYVPPGLRA